MAAGRALVASGGLLAWLHTIDNDEIHTKYYYTTSRNIHYLL